MTFLCTFASDVQAELLQHLRVVVGRTVPPAAAKGRVRKGGGNGEEYTHCKHPHLGFPHFENPPFIFLFTRKTLFDQSGQARHTVVSRIFLASFRKLLFYFEYVINPESCLHVTKETDLPNIF